MCSPRRYASLLFLLVIKPTLINLFFVALTIALHYITVINFMTLKRGEWNVILEVIGVSFLKNHIAYKLIQICAFLFRDLSNNMLEELPVGLFDSNNKTHGLQTLLLQRNLLTYLSTNNFSGLKHLKSLWVTSFQASLRPIAFLLKVQIYSERLNRNCYFVTLSVIK